MVRILSLPVLLASWLWALGSWALFWGFLPVSQGLATWAAGGEFIGLSLAPWTQPWALVNQPSPGFAATNTALWSYWLPPFLWAVAVALVLPQLPPGNSLHRHLLLLQGATGAAFLGLGWLPGLGLEDGLLAGLARFFHQDPHLWRWGTALLAVLLLRPVTVALCSYLWYGRRGPTPRRRMVAVGLHLAIPAGLWVVLVALTAPRLPLASLGPFALVAVGTVTWAAFGKPPHPRRGREFFPRRLWLALAWVLLAVMPLGTAALPVEGRAKGYLWGQERMTSNVRREIHRLRLPLFPATPPAKSWPGS
ncbi:MAG: hypothetical protein N2447_00545 [Thermoanaerobaculum sp.]|nr:hypothetical protein [Thermoanaerobaculum sp.]